MHLPYGMFEETLLEIPADSAGRNLSQCMQATENMAIPSASMKRRLSNEYTEQTTKRLATTERPEYALHTHYPAYQPLPPPTAPHVNILPRPMNGDIREPRSPAPKADVPKKRGRPSRADKAKRDLHPLLPRPSMDQTSPVLQSPHPVASPASQNGLVPLAPKTDRLPSIVPGPRPSSATRPITPPEAYNAPVRSSASPRTRRASASPRVGASAPGAYHASQADATTSNSRARHVFAE